MINLIKDRTIRGESMEPKGVSHVVVPFEFRRDINPFAPIWEEDLINRVNHPEQNIFLNQNKA